MSEVEDEQECGYMFDHDEEVIYDGEDGLQWLCRRCGAEGFEEPQPAATPADSTRAVGHE